MRALESKVSRGAWALTASLSIFSASAADRPETFKEAEALWRSAANDTRYQRYAAEFASFNNHFRLDVKDGCYSLGSEKVTLLLLITHAHNSQFAMVERVFIEGETAKGRCFQRTYERLPTKVPPFLPFVLQMTMR